MNSCNEEPAVQVLVHYVALIGCGFVSYTTSPISVIVYTYDLSIQKPFGEKLTAQNYGL